MRSSAALPFAFVLAACATGPQEASALSQTCAEQYRECTGSPGDTEYCDAQMDDCKELRALTRGQRGAKQRGFEDYRRGEGGND